MVELKNYRSIIPARKCAAKWFHVPDEPQKKKIMSTNEFAEASGFPIRLIREYCRKGMITCWRHGGKKFLIDFDLAMDEIYSLTVRRNRSPKKDATIKLDISDKEKAYINNLKQFM